MNYFEARRAEILFREFKRLALDFWDAEENNDAERSRQLREQLNSLLYSANTFATSLNAGVTAQQLPPLAFGGAVIPVNFLRAVIDPDQGYGRISHVRALDAIDGCIGAAQYHRRKALQRLVNPLCWLVDGPAALARWPFLIMRKAGVPPSVEENLVSQVIKVIITISIFGVSAYFGVKVTLEDILKLWKR